MPAFKRGTSPRNFISLIFLEPFSLLHFITISHHFPQEVSLYTVYRGPPAPVSLLRGSGHGACCLSCLGNSPWTFPPDRLFLILQVSHKLAPPPRSPPQCFPLLFIPPCNICSHTAISSLTVQHYESYVHYSHAFKMFIPSSQLLAPHRVGAP